ncbi:MAG: PASTA domain-containing protein [Candidatus Hydrogenedentes bacterium]|nr:PASTA domain-containing protein [Candidatus Hydrogenedentota bacterium]
MVRFNWFMQGWLGNVNRKTRTAGLFLIVCWVLALSGCPKTVLVTVPDLAGMTRAESEALLGRLQFSVGEVTEAYSPSAPAGSVIGQSPAAGERVARGASVSMVLSKGPEPPSTEAVTVPDLRGMTEAEGMSSIQALGLVVGTVGHQYDSGVPAGHVLEQLPAAGSRVAPGAKVSFVLSRGPRLVPDLLGRDQYSAAMALRDADLAWGNVTYEHSETIPVGRVCGQSPAPGTPISVMAYVNIVISNGIMPVPVPNVVGMTQDAATEAIVAAGLVLGGVDGQFNATIPAGTVMSQNPTAGTNKVPGSPVSLVVSLGLPRVPNVVGLTRLLAEAAILRASLAVGEVTEQHDETVPAGIVMDQYPEPGTVSNPGRQVRLMVSAGPEPVPVPYVVGIPQAQAEAAIAAARLAVGSVSVQFSVSVPEGSVISQDPVGGTEVAPGTEVHLVVCGKPTIPNVVGKRAITDIQARFSSDTRAPAAFSPDGQVVITNTAGNAAKLWNVTSRQALFTLSHAEPVTSVAFSPQGDRVITGSEDWKAKIWDVQTGALLKTLVGHTGKVLAVAFSPDGTTVLTGSEDKTARVWNASTGGIVQTFADHDRGVSSVDYAPNGATVYTACGKVYAWSVASGVGSEMQSYGYTVDCSPDGRWLLVSGVSLGPSDVLDLQTGAVTQEIDMVEARFSPNGKEIYGDGRFSGGILLDVSTGFTLQRYPLPVLCVSSDGKSVLCEAMFTDGVRIFISNKLAAAQETLLRSGLFPGSVTSQLHDSIPRGHVVHQSPLAGGPAEVGSTVDLILSGVTE